MKQGYREFKPPLEVPLPHGVGILIHAAGADGRDGTVAVLEAWNGVLLHKNRVTLTTATQRQKFATALQAKVPEISVDEIAQQLMELESSLTVKLGEPEPGAVDLAPSVDVDALWAVTRDLASAPDLLTRVGRALEALGLVGERKPAVPTYLAATARLLLKPVNVLVKGPSSGGKSHTLKCVMALLPPSAQVNYSTVSPRFLAYCDDDLRHRIVVIYEADGLTADGVSAYIMRSLLSEGRLDLGTVDKNDGGSIEARRLTKEGPTALFTTTIHAPLEAQLETRALSLTINDTPEQSKKIMVGQGKGAAGQTAEPPDLAPFHALQEWLAAAGERRVLIPFAPQLAEKTPCTTIRIRRDFSMLLSMISACALLHQAQRPRAPGGEVHATLVDYMIIRELMAEAFAATQQDGLTPAQRQTVAAVDTLCKVAGAAEGVSVMAVAKHLGIDRSAAQRRLIGAAKGGYLKNLETRSRQPAIYILGEPLPEVITFLPDATDLERSEEEASG